MKKLRYTVLFAVLIALARANGAEPNREIKIINFTGRSLAVAFRTSDSNPLSNRFRINNEDSAYVNIGNAFEVYIVAYSDGKEHHWGWIVPTEERAEGIPVITLRRVWETKTREIEYWDSCLGERRTRTFSYSVSHIIADASKLEQVENK